MTSSLSSISGLLPLWETVWFKGDWINYKLVCGTLLRHEENQLFFGDRIFPSLIFSPTSRIIETAALQFENHCFRVISIFCLLQVIFFSSSVAALWA